MIAERWNAERGIPCEWDNVVVTPGGRPIRFFAMLALLDEAGVACLSGTAFGEYGEGYLRFSYANSLENIQWALASLKDFLAVRVRV